MNPLSEAHRLAQAKLGTETVAMVLAAYPLLDLDDPTDWLTVIAPMIQAQRARSSRLAGSYLEAFRRIETGESFAPVLAEPAASRQLTTAMLVTGVYHQLGNIGRGLTRQRAAELAKAASAGAGMRLALNGGRETITATVQADDRARGYARVTSGRACAFCSMLAGRGAVYGAESVNFEAHDHCACSGEPVYQ